MIMTPKKQIVQNNTQKTIICSFENKVMKKMEWIMIKGTDFFLNQFFF